MFKLRIVLLPDSAFDQRDHRYDDDTAGTMVNNVTVADHNITIACRGIRGPRRHQGSATCAQSNRAARLAREAS